MTFDLPSPVLKHTQVISGVQDIELPEGPFNVQHNDLIDDITFLFMQEISQIKIESTVLWRGSVVIRECVYSTSYTCDATAKVISI